MKKIVNLVLAVLLTGIAMAEDSIEGTETDVSKDWKLGMQAWTFNRFTLFETIDKTRALGLDWNPAFECAEGKRVQDLYRAGAGVIYRRRTALARHLGRATLGRCVSRDSHRHASVDRFSTDCAIAGNAPLARRGACLG